MHISAIIVAAGQGRRLGGTLPKQFQPLRGKPILFYTLKTFEESATIDEVTLVVSDDWLYHVSQEVVDKFAITKVRKIVPGGTERQDSVLAGLRSLESPTDLVVIHDGVRPFLSIAKLEEAIEAGKDFGAAILAIPPRDTIKIGRDGLIEKTLIRESLWSVQTPQVFKLDVITAAYQQAYREGFYGTDDSALVERAGYPVKIVMGDYNNLKITTALDLQVAESFLCTE
ncbi:MAG: 2-C-methyl-D-erythritol 4-phosphate cytidylyltransferase [bacterium]